MIICSCARISDKDIKSAIVWMRASDPQTVVTPGKLYRALGKRPDCGGCMRLLVASMRAELTSDLPIQLRGLRSGRKEEDSNEGRSKSRRIPQQGAQT